MTVNLKHEPSNEPTISMVNSNNQSAQMSFRDNSNQKGIDVKYDDRRRQEHIWSTELYKQQPNIFHNDMSEMVNVSNIKNIRNLTPGKRTQIDFNVDFRGKFGN